MKCLICACWKIDRVATWLGLWDDGNLLPMCDGCHSAGAGRGGGYVPDPIDSEGNIVKR